MLSSRPWCPWEWVARARSLGVYRETRNGILGAYHAPLLKLANETGLRGAVEPSFTNPRLISVIAAGGVGVLSISLKTFGYAADHLVLVHGITSAGFIVNDCANVIGSLGHNVEIQYSAVQLISNYKGISLFDEPTDR